MNALVAPCSFKESLTAEQAARAIARGIRRGAKGAQVTERPLADGGEGTVTTLVRALGGSGSRCAVRDPLGRAVEAEIGLVAGGTTAVVEVASAAGLGLLAPAERDPLRATTHGVADLVIAALDRGARRIWVGLGGSGTVDGGLGLLSGLGARLLREEGAAITSPHELPDLRRVDLSSLDPRLRDVEILALCDVASPLLGPRGARLYMPQKGASPEVADRLSDGLTALAAACARVGIDVADAPFAGAAGGLGAAFALLGARLVQGSSFVAEALGIDDLVRQSDLVVGGEGRVDTQTAEGKALVSLATAAKRHAKPLVVLCGARDEDLGPLHELGVSSVLAIGRGPATEAELMRTAEHDLALAATELARLFDALLARGARRAASERRT